MHFITGSEDRNTPADLTFEYYEAADAPANDFARVDGAVHMVMSDQPDALVEIKNKTQQHQLSFADPRE